LNKQLPPRLLTYFNTLRLKINNKLSINQLQKSGNIGQNPNISFTGTLHRTIGTVRLLKTI